MFLPQLLDDFLESACDLAGATDRRAPSFEDVVAGDTHAKCSMAKLAATLDERRGDHGNASLMVPSHRSSRSTAARISAIRSGVTVPCTLPWCLPRRSQSKIVIGAKPFVRLTPGMTCRRGGHGHFVPALTVGSMPKLDNRVRSRGREAFRDHKRWAHRKNLQPLGLRHP